MDKLLKPKNRIEPVKNWRWKIDKNSGNMGTSKEDDLCVEGFSEAFGKINKALENLQKWPFFRLNCQSPLQSKGC